MRARLRALRGERRRGRGAVPAHGRAAARARAGGRADQAALPERDPRASRREARAPEGGTRARACPNGTGRCAPRSEWSYDLLAGRGAGAVHEPRRLRRRASRSTAPRRSRASSSSTSSTGRVAPEQQPAPDRARWPAASPASGCWGRSASTRSSGWRARRRRGGAAPPRGLLRRARGGGRARAARATAAALARAARCRARQHPRRDDLGGRERRGGGRLADRRRRSGASGRCEGTSRRAASASSGCWRWARARGRRGPRLRRRSRPSRSSRATTKQCVVSLEASLPVHRGLGDDRRVAGSLSASLRLRPGARVTPTGRSRCAEEGLEIRAAIGRSLDRRRCSVFNVGVWRTDGGRARGGRARDRGEHPRCASGSETSRSVANWLRALGSISLARGDYAQARLAFRGEPRHRARARRSVVHRSHALEPCARGSGNARP